MLTNVFLKYRKIIKRSNSISCASGSNRTNHNAEFGHRSPVSSANSRKGSVVKRKFLTLAVVALTLCSAQVLSAQTRTRTLTQPAAALLNALPDSDAVARVKLGQLLNEALPQMSANICGSAS